MPFVFVARISLSEFERVAKNQIAALEFQLETKEKEQHEIEIINSRQEHELEEIKNLLKIADQRTLEAEVRMREMKQVESQLNQKIESMEKTYSDSLQKAADKESALQKTIQTMSKEIKELKTLNDGHQRAIKSKLNLTQDEINVLRTSRRSLNESSSSLSSGSNLSRSHEFVRLQSDVDSLRSVLELKLDEISKLSKQNEELMRDAEHRSVLQNKISILESSNEMLQSELKVKSDRERYLFLTVINYYILFINVICLNLFEKGI